MSYLLDTNAVIAVIKDTPGVRRRLRRAMASRQPVSVSAIAAYELWYGVARSARRRENSQRLRAFLSGAIRVLGFDEEDASVAGDLRARLEGLGTPIGPYDLLIAGQALRTGLTLVTANIREFSRVPDLVWEDWTA
ncbi:MAG: type II toxin-antitoxin system VapC family toxin [Candidatus Eremiobacterota bacterium]